MEKIILTLFIKGVPSALTITDAFVHFKAPHLQANWDETTDEDDYFQDWIYELAEIVEKHMGTTFDRFGASIDIIDVDVY